MQCGKTGVASTKAEVLEELLKDPTCPLVARHILEYRSNDKHIDFLQGVLQRVKLSRPFPASQLSQRGAPLLRAQCSIQQTRADTGRLSTDFPNVQARL